MRKIIVTTMVSLDGVMQAPGGRGEDPSGGFDLEGWTMPFMDEAGLEETTRELSEPFDLLLGKKTYDIFAAYWPHHPEGVGAPFNMVTKYVVSHEKFVGGWDETVVISGDVLGELAKLKAGDGPMLQVWGSSNLIQTLLAHDLVDELRLKIFPVTLGRGKRLFGEGTVPAAWKLLSSKTTPAGVLMAAYKRSGEVKTG